MAELRGHSWAMPTGVRQDWLSLNFMKGMNPIGSAGRETVEEDLIGLPSSTKLVALGSAPANATWGNIWLSDKDIYGREYALSRQYPGSNQAS